jgi:hypothetical protein
MLPRTTSIWQRDSQPTASGEPGAVQLALMDELETPIPAAYVQFVIDQLDGRT